MLELNMRSLPFLQGPLHRPTLDYGLEAAAGAECDHPPSVTKSTLLQYSNLHWLWEQFKVLFLTNKGLKHLGLTYLRGFLLPPVPP